MLRPDEEKEKRIREQVYFHLLLWYTRREEITIPEDGNLKEYNAYIFDMDGTVLDTLTDLGNAMNRTMRKHGYPGDFTSEVVGALFGSGARVAVTRAVALMRGYSLEELEQVGTDHDIITPTLPAGEIDAILADYKPDYAAHCDENTGPYEGTPELPSVLRAQGKKCAVVSNKPDPAVQELAQSNYPGLFEFAVGEREGVRRKPAPDTVFAAMEHMQVSPSESVYIGDSEIDLQTAANAGLDVIAVTWGFRTAEFLRARGADVLVDHPMEILP